MPRKCPNCHENTMSIVRLAIWSAKCRKCGARIGFHLIWSTLFYMAHTIVLIFGGVYVAVNYGITPAGYFAAIWLGLGFLQGFFLPLEVKATAWEP